MGQIEIREIFSGQITTYKAFLRAGLMNDEENFRITPADDESAQFPTKDKADSFTLGAYIHNKLAGVVSFAREGADREKLRHKGLLFRMYVAPEARGKGAAKALISEVITRARMLSNMEQINLTVVAGNADAKGLYEKFGFVTYGNEPNAIKWKGKYFAEELMLLVLNNTQ